MLDIGGNSDKVILVRESAAINSKCSYGNTSP